MGGTTRSTAGKRTDCPAVVCGERNQDQELLLPTAKGPGTVYPVCTRRRSADCTAATKCRYPDREERSAYLTADQYYAGYTAGIGECAMLNDLPAGQQVYLITGYTDLRRSIDGLASIIQGQLNLDPFSTALFLFCGRRRDRIKCLLWESDGFLLLYKRLDNGCFQWPRSEMEAKLLTPQQVRWLLEGLKIEQPKAIREGKPGALY